MYGWFAYMYVCATVCVYCPLRLEDVSDALEPELQTIVSFLMGAGNQTTILQNNNHQSHLYSSSVCLFFHLSSKLKSNSPFSL